MKKGFTLIELLVVIAIIAILAAILFPVFSKAREKARQSTCTSNQKQIAIGLAMAIQENDETLPGLDVWSELGISGKVLQCPTAGKKLANAYVFNRNILTKGFAKIPNPVRTFASADGLHEATAAVTTPVAIGPTNANLAYNYSDLVARHDGNVIASFVDGHVETTKIGGFIVKNVFPGERTEIDVKSDIFAKLSLGKALDSQGYTLSTNTTDPIVNSSNYKISYEHPDGITITEVGVPLGANREMRWNKVMPITVTPTSKVMIEFDYKTNVIAKDMVGKGYTGWSTLYNFTIAFGTAKGFQIQSEANIGAAKVEEERVSFNKGAADNNITGTKKNVWYKVSLTYDYSTDKVSYKVFEAGSDTPIVDVVDANSWTPNHNFYFSAYSFRGVELSVANVYVGEPTVVTYPGP